MRTDGRDSTALKPAPVYSVVHPRHIYVHVPFCARRCAYCDFSIAVRRTVPADEYVAGLGRELDRRYADGIDWPVDTLYFGGGTPSRLGADGVAYMLETVRSRIVLADDAEVTLEANPDDIDADSVTAWRRAGITRLSIGAQSFDDRVLTWMRRTHDAAAIDRAVDIVRRGGFENFSLDLIFALPDPIARSWSADVGRAIDLGPSHLSLYGLTIEPQTPLGRWRARGDVAESPDERYEDEFLYAHSALAAAGFEHYEVSNFARLGSRARHNSSYWSGVPYAGLGPSAHGFDGERRRWNASAYPDWLRKTVAGDDPMDGFELLTEQNRAAERVYLGLRTIDGLVVTGEEIFRVQPWLAAGWATIDGSNRVVLTPLGWLRLDALASDLTLVRSHY